MRTATSVPASEPRQATALRPLLWAGHLVREEDAYDNGISLIRVRLVRTCRRHRWHRLRHAVHSGDRTTRITDDLFETVGARSGRRIVTFAHWAFHEFKRAIHLWTGTSARAPIDVRAARLHFPCADVVVPKTFKRTATRRTMRRARFVLGTHHPLHAL